MPPSPSAVAAAALALLGGFGAARAQQPLEVTYSGATPSTRLAQPFIATNIDTGSLFNGMNFSDVKLRNYAAQMGPTVIRVGGTAADYALYLPDTPYVPGTVNGNNATGAANIGTQMLDQLVDFMLAANATMLFDFDGLQARTAAGAWDPSVNATKILAYLDATYGVNLERFTWSVGNEPDLWPVASRVSPTQLGLDAVTLSAALTSFNVGRAVYGPSYAFVNASNARQYLAAAKDVLTGFTVHSYPWGHPCNVSRYVNVTNAVYGLRPALASVTAAAAEVGYGGLLVLEETAGSAGGGCDGITNRFVSGFSWLSTINNVAAAGFHRVHRQDLAGWSFAAGRSHYELTGPPGWVNGSALLDPKPDWFLTVLAKTVLGPAQLATAVSGDPATTLNVDLHYYCGAGGNGSSVVLSYVNTLQADVPLAVDPSLTSLPWHAWQLTSDAQSWHQHRARVASGALLREADAPRDYPASLTGNSTYLNGALLTVDPDTALLPPDWMPVTPQPGNAPVVLPPLSFGFFVFTASEPVPACAA